MLNFTLFDVESYGNMKKSGTCIHFLDLEAHKLISVHLFTLVIILSPLVLKEDVELQICVTSISAHII